VPYIICIEVDEAGQPKEGGSSGLAERAFHREELATNSALRVDVQYYLANQVGGRSCTGAECIGSSRCSLVYLHSRLPPIKASLKFQLK
jgi:hypothetical protein